MRTIADFKRIQMRHARGGGFCADTWNFDEVAHTPTRSQEPPTTAPWAKQARSPSDASTDISESDDDVIAKFQVAKKGGWVFGNFHGLKFMEAPGPEAHYVFHAMASGSVLDGLRYSRFLADEDAATGVTASTTEGRYGIPRYNGDPSRLNEWIFRAKTLERKEAALTDEQKKLGPLTLRLIECFSGQALKIAQGLDMAKLEKPDTGLTYLIDSLSGELRPRRLQQARELYEAGAQTGGIMARNPMESMGQYVLRRRAWYRALVDLNAELKLPDLILSEQLLNNAGLTHDQKAYDTNGDWR
ncbi:hypothetical protein AK812_SmicGene16908 [Symbiodinium microadriaticum]|uniref:Uncharacterized protein n=1 Tax=Symbiodinium microadriaticum TaxID=2951 RepID=A0A1Q9DZ49_SYMMI|nr:hypothetical protein AK812_SmicGene16908 [Symbiodinium microadriaticum]